MALAASTTARGRAAVLEWLCGFERFQSKENQFNSMRGSLLHGETTWLVALPCGARRICCLCLRTVSQSAGVLQACHGRNNEETEGECHGTLEIVVCIACNSHDLCQLKADRNIFAQNLSLGAKLRKELFLRTEA